MHSFTKALGSLSEAAGAMPVILDTTFFVFRVEDLAKAFISAPEAAAAGRESGVVDGDYWFVTEV